MAGNTIRDVLEPVRTPVYTFLGATLVLQIADYLLVSAPFHLSMATWRFSAFGSMASAIGNIILLVLLMHVFALACNDRKPLAFVGIFTGVFALVLVLCSAGFVLDALQLKANVQTGTSLGFTILWTQALLKVLVEVVILIMFSTSAIKSWRSAARDMERSAARPERSGDDLLVGRSTGRPSAS